jgi:hypothetical protein
MIIKLSKLNAGKRPAQRTMDRLARSSIPDDRIECDLEYKVIAGKEQYWRHIAKGLPTADVITPVDREQIEKDKIIKFKDDEVASINAEVEDHQNKIAELVKRRTSIRCERQKFADAEIADEDVERCKRRLLSVKFAREASETDDYVKLCESGYHAEKHGQVWEPDDVTFLRAAMRNGVNVVKITRHLGRTPFAIMCKAIQQGLLSEKNAYKVMRGIVSHG